MFNKVKPLILKSDISFETINFRKNYLTVAGYPLNLSIKTGSSLTYDLIKSYQKIDIFKTALKGYYTYDDQQKEYNLGHKDWRVIETPMFAGISGGSAIYGSLNGNEQHYFLGVAVTHYFGDTITNDSGYKGTNKGIFSELSFFQNKLNNYLPN